MVKKELEQAKAQLWKEDAERYRILSREMSEVDRRGSSRI
jgi:hypothetical protein